MPGSTQSVPGSTQSVPGSTLFVVQVAPNRGRRLLGLQIPPISIRALFSYGFHLIFVFIHVGAADQDHVGERF